jgi:hypothetical protein
MLSLGRGKSATAKGISTVAAQVVAHWHCASCDVEGRDPAAEPSCWNCGGTVIVTARPSLEWSDAARPAA